jgi:glycine/D-amino acid oxidase-like deaminating enzyme
MDITASLRDAQPNPYWLQDPSRPEPQPALTRDTECDLLVVGGGYSGLWTALLAKEADPALDVVLVEGDRVGWAASGRNGGFCAASLTHGLGNGLQRWPDEFDLLQRLGNDNLQSIEDTLNRYGVDCAWERTGGMDVATQPHQLPELREAADCAARHGIVLDVLDAEQVRAEVNSPSFLGGVWDRRGVAMVNPAQLAWGLARAAETMGVRIYENTLAVDLAAHGSGMAVRTNRATIRAGRVALGTNAFPSLVRRVRPYVVPVYDYALMTEPLSVEQRAAIGWRNRQGLADLCNQFHYFRMTADHRILWGGYDAIYHYRGRVRTEHDHRPATYRRLAKHFFRTFPQLEGVRFTHTWGGAIDTCTRFSAFFGTAYDARVAYATGYTGLGVGATRFGAAVMLDLLAGRRTERTSLAMVRTKPLPFPPEPLRWAAISLTKWSLDRADRQRGRRNLWLRSMDRLGFGFDS